MVSWESYKQMQKADGAKSIASQLSAAHVEEVRRNRKYIMKIADILRLITTQGIALRGHDESALSDNRGNFIQILHHIAKNVPSLKRRIEEGPKNAKYTHHTIQNSILHIFADLTLAAISNKVKEAKYFALIADESKDISKTEQLSVVVRYYLNDIHNCVAQAYDGANVMSGHCKGVQSLLKKEVPQAVYVHCFNHILNLVIVDVCKAIKTARNFFSFLQSLYVFLSGSVTHNMFLKAQEQLNIAKTELKSISDTRWTCQFASCSEIKKTFPVILITLFQCKNENHDRAVTARCLLNEINMSFIFHLHFFYEVLKETKVVSDLQNKEFDVANASNLIESCSDHFSEMRNSCEEFKRIWTESVTIAKNNNINIECPFGVRPRKLPPHLQQFITESPHSEEISASSSEEYRTRVFIPVLDTIISEIDRRFTKNNKVLQGINTLQPNNKLFLDLSQLKYLAEQYACDVDAVAVEVKVLPKLIKRYEDENQCKIQKLAQLLTLLDEYQLAFHELFKLAVIAATIPVSSASCERSFSCLRRLKTCPRNSMTNKGLSDLALLIVEKETVKQVNLAAVMDKFDSEHQNRRIRLH
ncbi:unnamed protein product [Lasius platythorax]|uniref:Zinc finger MYM-type protein 1 n=1 Tax=Lasius platythorax TaxID=488582 RepID=A0AAV2MXF7_9HYME